MNNKYYTGGQWIEVAAPLDRIPIFVRAGAAFTLPQKGLAQRDGNRYRDGDR
jgi:alpha-glucosidase (family GH31 glycosyl hydrolase)